MASESIELLKATLAEIEVAASRATTRAEVLNLRALWASIKSVIDKEEAAG